MFEDLITILTIFLIIFIILILILVGLTRWILRINTILFTLEEIARYNYLLVKQEKDILGTLKDIRNLIIKNHSYQNDDNDND